jgi:hypothetical protein
MALCRCHQCGKPDPFEKRKFVASVHPIGYPDTAAICGTEGCNIPGMIWLTELEFKDYQQKGTRIFTVPTVGCKLKAI